MKENLRNLLLSLLLLLPVLALNSGWNEVSAIVGRWQNLEQERFANQKLAEIAANTDIAEALARTSVSFKSGLSSLLREYPDRSAFSAPLGALASSVFGDPFPLHDLWVFSKSPGSDFSVVYSSDNTASRRSMEMIAGSLVAENIEEIQKPEERRRNVKLLQKVFGNGCSTELIACEQRGVATPIIYRKTPAFLVWDFTSNPDGRVAAFFLIVRRDQDLPACALRMVAKKTGLGQSLAGGFVKIFASAGPDILYPKTLSASKTFKAWRDKLGNAEEKLYEWEARGFAWGLPLGKFKLYARILPFEKHLAVLLLPGSHFQGPPGWLKIVNFVFISLVLVIIVRGLILGIWPFKSIGSRFAVAFLLASTLPVVLYITSATAYVFERLKADENHLEELLTTSLSDFDAGKELLEAEYLSAFAAMKSDRQIESLLIDGGLANSDRVFARVREIARSQNEQLAVSSVALYDLAGDCRFDSRGNIKNSDFETVAKFYGLPFTLNLRKLVSQDEPDFVLPVHKVDKNNLIGTQSFKKPAGTIDGELERLRFRVVTTSVGRGQLGYIYDFFSTAGKNRFVLMVAWLGSDIDKAVIQHSADQLMIRAPQIKLFGLKRTAHGDELVLRPDRGLNGPQLKACRQIADAAFSIRSGLLKTAAADMSVVAYASKHFDKTVFVGAMEHSEKNSRHQQRVLVFVLLGLMSLFMLVVSGVILWLRVVEPLREIKTAFDDVECGRSGKISTTCRSDEIGLLAGEFAEMQNGLAERRRLASLLSEHAVAAVVNASADGMIASESFWGVVLVSDIRNFTTICEMHSPPLVTSLLNSHMTEMASIISSFGGKIYKFIGDAIEAVFVDDYHFNHSPCVRAALAGAAMLQKVHEINAMRVADGLFDYRIGVGLAKGELVAGEVGSQFSRRDYAMFGSAFRRAEEFEGMTRGFPDCPLIADRYVVEATTDDSFVWVEISADPECIFRLACLNEAILKKISTTPANINMDLPQKKMLRDLPAGSLSPSAPIDKISVHNRKILVFIAGLFCILFPFFAWIFTLRTGNNAMLLQAGQNARSYCENIAARLSVPDSQPLMLEEYLDELSEDLAADVPWNPCGADLVSFESAASGMLVKLKSAGLEPSLLGILHKPGGAGNITPDQNWKLVSYIGDAKSRDLLTDTLRLFAWQYYFDSWLSPGPLMPKINQMLGNGMEFRHLYNDAHARVITVKKGAVDEYLYWQPLLLRNSRRISEAMRDFSCNAFRQKPPADVLLQCGVVLCLIPRQKVFENHLMTIRHVLEREKIEFALIGPGIEPFVTNGFPVDAGDLKNSLVSPPAGWHMTGALIKAQGQECQVFIACKTLEPAENFVWFVLILALLIVAAWYKSVFYESLIARRFAWQFWAGLFAAAVIPIASVYTVNDWFAIEQMELRPKEERVRIISSFERLERRQFMQEILAWDKIEKLSLSSELATAVDSVDKGSKDVKFIDRVVKKLAEVRHDYTGPVRFNEMIMVSTKGWQQTVYADDSELEATEFKRFIGAFINMLFNDLGVSENEGSVGAKTVGVAVKDEMTRDAGLHIFRTMFGTDNYFTLVHGIDMSFRIFISTGLASMRMIPLPEPKKLRAVAFWLFFDSFNSTMRRIFKNADIPYAVYTESKAMYGALKQPWTGGWEPDVNRFARWTLASRTPLSARAVFAGRNCLVEARIGSHNEVMLMVGITPEDEIFDAVERSRKRFLYMLMVSLLAIVALALLVSADITGPVVQLTLGVKMIAAQHDYCIAVSRRDELGQMMLAFNKMARGLREREMMGHMVSSAARRMVRDEESLRLAEEGHYLSVTVLYLSIPDFSSYMESMDTHELLEKTSRQIDALCGIIINSGGEADKIIGEKILAYFYSPAGLAESNSMAMHAVKLIKEAELEGVLHFPVAAGIHAGEIIAGLLGVSSQRDFTIIGDAVNTAARINAMAAGLGSDRYLVSQAVADTLNDNMACFRVHESVQLKGKAERIKLLQILFT